CRERREDQREDGDIIHGGVGEYEWKRQRRDQREERPAELDQARVQTQRSLHVAVLLPHCLRVARRPNSPCGRNSSSSTRAMKNTALDHTGDQTTAVTSDKTSMMMAPI